MKENSAKGVNTVWDSLVISSVKEDRVPQGTHGRKMEISYIITNISSVRLIYYMSNLLVEST